MKFNKLIVPITLIAIGQILVFAGAMFKLQHYKYGNVFMLMGLLMSALAIILFVSSLVLRQRKNKTP